MTIYASIYKCTNIITNESYIGYDSNWPSRKTKHLYDCANPNSKNYNCHFYRAIRKYGINNFLWEVIYQSWDKTYCLNEMETTFIKEYDTFLNGYNMTYGGEGTLGKKSWLGKKHSDETRRKISEANKGKIRSKEHSENISKSKLGKKVKPFTDEHKKKISESRKGKKPFEMTEEIAQKISNSLSGGNHYSAKPVNVNGIFYSCKKEAIQKLGINSYQLNKLLSANLR